MGPPLSQGAWDAGLAGTTWPVLGVGGMGGGRRFSCLEPGAWSLELVLSASIGWAPGACLLEPATAALQAATAKEHAVIVHRERDRQVDR